MTKTSRRPLLLGFRSLLLLLPAVVSAAPLDWTSAEGKTIEAEFVRLDGESVVVRKAGKELPIPLAKLCLASRNQARDLAAKLPALADTPAEPALPVESFGKQEDPDHQRKLAVSVLTKKGQIEIWRGTGQLLVTQVENLPAGRLELKSVDAVGSSFSDEDALLLNGCKELTRLNLHRCSVRALPLKTLTSLQSIELYQSDVSLPLLSALRGHQALKAFTLHHSTTRIGKGLVPLLAEIPNLDIINLHRAGIDEDSLAAFSRLKMLKHLCLGGHDFTDAELLDLATLPALEVLNLAETNLLDHTLGFLPKIKTLKVLDLGGCRLGERTLTAVAEIRSLAVLQLWNASLSDEMLKPLGGHKGLSELLIAETPLTGEGFAGLKPLQNLTRFHFDGGKTRMSEAGLQALIQACPNVSELAVSAGNLEPGALARLPALRNLATLFLAGGATLDAESIRVLSGMKLTTLGLDGSKVSDELLTGFLPLKSKLAELRLRDTRVSDACLPTLEQFRGLTHLYISGTDITKDGAGHLRKSLRTCTIHH